MEKIYQISEKQYKQCLKNLEDLRELRKLADDLGWEHQKMTSCGKENLEKMWKILGLPNFSEINGEA